MRRVSTMAVASLCLAAVQAAGAAVTVDYVHPEGFTDLPRIARQRDQALQDFTEHFETLGRGLPSGTDMKIDVLDIDLAGHERPNAFGNADLRVVGGPIDAPRMRLRYTVSRDGKVVAQGEARLDDAGFRERINMYPSSARWPREFQMIDDWWNKTMEPTKGGRQ